MAQEKAGFRDVMALLNEMFPNCGMLTPRQAAQFIGCSLATVYRRIRFNPVTHRITKTDLAHQICA